MRRLRITTLIFIVIILAASITVHKKQIGSQIDNLKKNKGTESTVSTKLSTEDGIIFTVLGDVHGNTVKLENAIKDLHNINGNMDAIVLNGDNVDQGIENQYSAMGDILNKNREFLPKIIIKNIGNHNYFDYAKGQNKPEDVQHFINMYLKFADEKSVYHDTWIKGYHFISLGSESGNTKKLGSVNAFLSETQLDWLKEKLAEKYEKGKPIFMFLHQHLSTSIRGWNGVEQKDELNKILDRYPEVILFTSHTHVLLSVDNVEQSQPFTIVHTGAVSYGILPEGYRIKRLYNESQGLYIEVHGNRTLIKGRDFAKKSWIFSKEIG